MVNEKENIKNEMANTDQEKEQGYVCKVFRGTRHDYKSLEDIPETRLEYTPVGWWGNPIEVTIQTPENGEINVALSTASGGQINESSGGYSKIENMIAALQDSLKVIYNERAAQIEGENASLETATTKIMGKK